ncbi:MAG: S-layer homology domain-containing protein [Clostridia bacterium]|nr:S-layer homology domain-containing protein [Clostridia bacterium]
MIKRMTALVLILIFGLTLPACAFDVSDEGENARDAGAFIDVPADAWYAEAAASVCERGLMTGVGEGRFSPDGHFTRAQLATVLYRMAGEPEASSEDGFTDTDPNAWYARAVFWAWQNKVINGVGDGLFAPDTPATQQMLVTMLWRMAGEPAALKAEDADEYASVASGWARANGAAPTQGEYVYAPKETATRAQTAYILERYLDLSDAAQPQAEKITLTAAGRTLEVEWYENSTVEALRELLKKGDITLTMTDYGGFEKGAPLPEALPENNEQMNTDAGDIILYRGQQFVIYYDKNSWSLTPLGKITGLEKSELRELLGEGDVTAVLSIGE